MKKFVSHPITSIFGLSLRASLISAVLLFFASSQAPGLQSATAEEDLNIWLYNQAPPNEVSDLLRQFPGPLSSEFIKNFPVAVRDVLVAELNEVSKNGGVCETPTELFVDYRPVRENLKKLGTVVGPNEGAFLKSAVFIHGCGSMRLANDPRILTSFFNERVKKEFFPETVSVTQMEADKFCEKVDLSYGPISIGETYSCYKVIPFPNLYSPHDESRRGFLTWEVFSTPSGSSEPIYFRQSLFATIGSPNHYESKLTNLHFFTLSRWENMSSLMKLAAEQIAPSRVNKGIRYITNSLENQR